MATMDTDPTLLDDVLSAAAMIHAGHPEDAREIVKAMVRRNLAAARDAVAAAEGTAEDDRSRAVKVFGVKLGSYKPRRVRNALNTVSQIAEVALLVTGREA
jgi:predicted subunit of tRNA(5-methylaminomethyl-2-thiouridylate) methyltransferase